MSTDGSPTAPELEVAQKLESDEKHIIPPNAAPGVDDAPVTFDATPVKEPKLLYQTAHRVHIIIRKKNAPKDLRKDETDIVIEEGSLKVNLPAAGSSPYEYTASPLFAKIDPSRSKFVVSPDKIEITLYKVEEGLDWATIAGTDPIAPSEPSEPTAPEPMSDVIRELPGDEKEDVLFDTIYGVRTIDLNRPKKLHALSGSMIRKIVPRLQEWAKSDMANVIIMRGTGPSKQGAPKAFCAGGDVTSLALDNKLGEEGQQRSQDYFGLEYKLDHLIATYTKPFIAFMDGITMGGGVGLSIHAPFRIATENTVFAMPETKIGFFPDVGASFFLPRMPGGVGTYLALTSERLTGANVFYSGIATHFIHSTTMPALQRRLAEIKFNDWDSMAERLQLVNDTIEEYCTGLPHDQPMLICGALRKAIDRCFTKDSVDEILKALRAEEGDMKEWAENTINTLDARSPTAVHVTLRQMRLGARWSLAETFQREHQIAGKFMRHPDFVEGVDAVLIRRTNDPKWSPATLEDIKPEDSNAIVDPFFEVEGEARLKLLNEDDFSEYRWQKFSMPRESDVQREWMKGGQSKNRVADKFIDARLGKQGVKEVVREMLSRKAKKDEKGNPIWE